MAQITQNQTIQPNKISLLSRLLLLLFAAGLNIDSFTVSLGFIKMSPVTLVGFLYLISCLNYFGRFGIVYKKYKKIVIYLIFLLTLLIFINIINSNDISHEVVPNDFLFCIILFFVSICHMEFDSFAYKYLLGGIVLGGLTAVLLFNLGIGVEYDSTMNRLFFFGKNPNNMGCMICISFAIIFYKNVIKSDKVLLVKMLFLSLLLPCLMMIFATGSRTAFVALVLVVATIFFYSSRGLNTGRKFLLWIVLIIGVYFGFRLLLSSEVMFSRLMLSQESSDVSGRDQIWSRLIKLALNHPFGIGQTGYTEYSFHYMFSTDIRGLTSPHNVFLEIAIYTGIIGLLIFVSFVLKLFKSSRKTFMENHDLLPILIFEILLIQMNVGQLLNYKMAWLIFAYMITNASVSNYKISN